MDVQDNNDQVYPSLTTNNNNSNEEGRKFIDKFQLGDNGNNYGDGDGLSKFQCYKNLLVISFSFFFLFSSFNAIANLQSSLNSVSSMGTVSLFVIYSAFALSCLVLPSLLTSKFGYKWSLFMCEIAYCVYIVTNLYSKWWTLIPAAFILGLGAAPLWTIQGCLITDLANEYAPYSTDKIEALVSRFFGIFMIVFQSNQVVGNLISSLVLRRKPLGVDESLLNSTFLNFTNGSNKAQKKDFSYCGINDCPGSASGEALIPPDMKTVYIMCGIYIGCAVTGVLILAFFLDNLKIKKSKDDLAIKEQILETILMFKDYKVWLLLPLVALHPFMLAFISTDISKAFVSCMLGVEYVGYWFVIFGITAALFSYIVGFIAKYIGRIPLIITGLLVSASLNIFLLLWKTNGEQYIILYLLAVFYGTFEAIHQTQVNALVGVTFPDTNRAAYSANRLCLSIAGAIGYAYSGYLCVKIKCFIILATFVLSLASYSFLEFRIRKEFRYSQVQKK